MSHGRCVRLLATSVSHHSSPSKEPRRFTQLSLRSLFAKQQQILRSISNYSIDARTTPPYVRRFSSTSHIIRNSRLEHKFGTDLRGTQCITNAFIALGSNVGDRLHNIENACRMIDEDDGMLITQTSALYETEPMYVEDQDSFLNAVCEVQTSLKPLELLDRLQAIEKRLGRVKTIDKGPRSVDLDIILYGNEEVATDRLTVPHALAKEREFVLRPLSDISTARYQKLGLNSELRVKDYLNQVAEGAPSMLAQTPLTNTGLLLKPQDIKRRTHVMSILNMTPDSFSDGGKHQTTNLDAIISIIKAQIGAGVTIIDIGGQSSRPNAPNVSVEEETSRVLPVIKAIRPYTEAAGVAISIDTYRSAVAESAIKAGAHIVNDISSGLLDPEMLPTVSRLGCTFVMMHIRGTPSTMQSPENCSYPNGLLRTVAEELSQRINEAQAAGIRRWRMVLDPGIGFAKNVDQNLELLRDFHQLKANPQLRNFPWLVGSSRKSFVGKAAGVTEPTQRDWATAATVTAAIHGGADVVRVHNAESMSDVAKMADAIYRAY